MGEPRATGREGPEQRKKQALPLLVRCNRTVRGPSRSSSNASAEQTPGRPARKREAENQLDRGGRSAGADLPTSPAAQTLSPPSKTLMLLEGRRAFHERSPARRQCRPPRSSAKAAIAAWATIRPRSTRSPIVWRRPKAKGRHSIALAGAAWSIRIRTGKPAASALPFQAKAATKSRALRAPDATWGMRERVDRRRRSAPRPD